MKDRFFYPLVIALIAAGITFALSFGGTGKALEEQDIIQNGFVFDGEQFASLTAAPGTAFTIAGDADDPAAYAVFSAHIAKDKAPESAGAFATLGPEYKKAFSGKTIKVTVRARKGRANPTDAFQMGYFAMGSGQSGWKEFLPESDFKDFSFNFLPKLATDESQTDFVGIWPDKAGENRTLDVDWIKVEIVSGSQN